jgi:hypothetical protein
MGKRIDIDLLPTFYSGLMSEAEALFKKLSCYQSTDLPFLLSDVFDNKLNALPEFSFLDGNGSHDMESISMRNLQGWMKHGLVIRKDEDGKVVWNRKMMEEIMANFHQLNQILMVLLHISAQPARATELFTMTFRNQQNVHRTLFASNGELCSILAYSKVTGKTGKERPIPRWLHSGLSNLFIKYLLFFRFTEEVFAGELWGAEAAEVLHYDVFYHSQGRHYERSREFGALLEEKTLKYLGVALGVQEWRHFTTATGRKFLIGILDPLEDLTTGMDAQAGRETLTSESIYALQAGDLGKLNERILACFYACNRLWWVKMYCLPVEGRVANLKEIVAENGGDERGHGKDRSVPSLPGFDMDKLAEVLRTQLKLSVVEDILPQIQEVLRAHVYQRPASPAPMVGCSSILIQL